MKVYGVYAANFQPCPKLIWFWYGKAYITLCTFLPRVYKQMGVNWWNPIRVYILIGFLFPVYWVWRKIIITVNLYMKFGHEKPHLSSLAVPPGPRDNKFSISISYGILISDLIYSDSYWLQLDAWSLGNGV